MENLEIIILLVFSVYVLLDFYRSRNYFQDRKKLFLAIYSLVYLISIPILVILVEIDILINNIWIIAVFGIPVGIYNFLRIEKTREAFLTEGVRILVTITIIVVLIWQLGDYN